MKSKYLTNLSLIALLTLLNSCGGGSSSTNNSDDDIIIDINHSINEPKDIEPKEDSKELVVSENTDENTSILAKNEPYYKYSWHIDSKDSILNTKGYTIDENADINILKAWEITKGKDVRVAVIDDAFEVNHEDLKENIYITYNADDDSSDVANKNSIDDEYGASHGNTCAGFIVAPINGKGIIGTAPESKLIAIKLLSESDSDTIKAFEYAKNQGAKVISCSWGTGNISEALENELKSIYNAGITVVFASGNEGRSLDDEGVNDESESEWVIGVGASGENNDVTTYSNYGSKIDIIAPAGDSLDSAGILGIDDSGERGVSSQKDLVTNNYAFTDGTSFATPVTAGVVALMYSVNPNITPLEVRNILINNADKVGNSDSYVDGFEEKRAYGKINAEKVVLEAQKI
jgi:subtilisin family serine protease